MLKAKHSKIARLIFNPYIDRLMKKSFTSFYLVNQIPEFPEKKGLIITPNHISWWDGFFIDYISRKFIPRKLHLMMLESSLKKYWFFNKLGSYSINPENSKSLIETAEYTGEILNDPSNFVITYPQGEIEPFEKRPLSIKEGIKFFIKKNPEDIFVLPVGFKIQFYNEKNPAIICRFGNFIRAEKILENFDFFKIEFTNNLDKLNEAACSKNFVKDIFK